MVDKILQSGNIFKFFWHDDRRTVNVCQIKFLNEILVSVPNWPQSAHKLQNLRDKYTWANWWLSALKKIQRTNTAEHTRKHHSRKQSKRSENASTSHSGIADSAVWGGRQAVLSTSGTGLAGSSGHSSLRTLQKVISIQIISNRSQILRWFRSKSIISNQSQILLRRF